MSAMQVFDVTSDGRTHQTSESDITRLSFSVMVTPTYDPIRGLTPAVFGCRPCGKAWMITSPVPFGTCRGCGRQLEIITP